MVAQIFPQGGTVSGPFLREMSRLAHTEFKIHGYTNTDLRQILRESMFSPAVTGSPLENACRVIKKYEPNGRGFYSGVAALVEANANKTYSLDSAIMIRTAEISMNGAFNAKVGATIVRHSNPAEEVKETKAKAHALLKAAGCKEVNYV